MRRESPAIPIAVWAACLGLGLLTCLVLPDAVPRVFLAEWFAVVWLGIGVTGLLALR